MAQLFVAAGQGSRQRWREHERGLTEVAMSSRVGVVVGVVSCLAFAIITSPMVAAQTAVPSEQDIGQALRPVPKGLGVHQGLPTLGTVPGANENPNVHGASVSPGPSKRKRAAPDATTSHEQANAEPRSAITFNTIQFSFGSAQITPESSETLRNLGNALNHELVDQKSFLIEGHTDAAGSPEVNTALSRRRAEAVRDYLIHDMGVSPSRLQAVGKGSSDPANPADPYAAENRRVVVINMGS
jgi:outer membrane protein OmpA-like peptidoglycan-associated protein